MLGWCSNCAFLVVPQLLCIDSGAGAQIVLGWRSNCARLVLKLCSAGAQIVLGWGSNCAGWCSNCAHSSNCPWITELPAGGRGKLWLVLKLCSAGARIVLGWCSNCARLVLTLCFSCGPSGARFVVPGPFRARASFFQFFRNYFCSLLVLFLCFFCAFFCAFFVLFLCFFVLVFVHTCSLWSSPTSLTLQAGDTTSIELSIDSIAITNSVVWKSIYSIMDMIRL